MSRYGFIGDDKKVYLTRCPKCQLENWAPAVASGQCSWCGYRGRYEDIKDDNDIK